jgi:fructose transport system permease protein
VSDQAGPTEAISNFEANLDKADTPVQAFEQDDRTPLRIVRAFLRTNPTAIPAIILVGSILLFGAIAPNFLKTNTLSLVLQQVTVTGIIAIAQTVIILSAGIDLSVGAILVLSTMIMGKLSIAQVAPVPLAIVIGILFAGLMGYVNGALVAYIKLPPFIVTVGTLSIFSTLTLWYSGSESIRSTDIEEKAPFLLWFGNTFDILGAQIAYGSVAFIALAFIVWYMLNCTPWGTHVHAVGDDPDAALLAGVQTDRVVVSVYVFAAVICGFCAWIAIGRVGSIAPQSFQTANLDSITATVIGGTSLFGGRCSIFGSVLGALIVGIFNTGLSLAGVDDYWQLLTVGVLVIVAVTIDRWLRRVSR